MVEIQVLQYFLAVAQEGSITGAAKALHITQPTLSRQLQQMEEELEGTITLGCGETMSTGALARMCASFQRQHPRVSFDFYTAGADDPLAVQEAVAKKDLLQGKVILPRRLHVQSTLAHWFGRNFRSLNVSKRKVSWSGSGICISAWRRNNSFLLLSRNWRTTKMLRSIIMLD